MRFFILVFFLRERETESDACRTSSHLSTITALRRFFRSPAAANTSVRCRRTNAAEFVSAGGATPRSATGVIERIHRDDHLALRAAFLEVGERVGDLVERKDLVDNDL